MRHLIDSPAKYLHDAVSCPCSGCDYNRIDQGTDAALSYLNDLMIQSGP